MLTMELVLSVGLASFMSTVFGAGAVYAAIRKDIFYLRRDVDRLIEREHNNG